VLSISVGRVEFYSCYLLDFRIHYREPSRKTCRERADRQEDNSDPTPRGEGYACARVFQHDHFKSVTQSECSIELYIGSGHVYCTASENGWQSLIASCRNIWRVGKHCEGH
jgi:hypothetical protein